MRWEFGTRHLAYERNSEFRIHNPQAHFCIKILLHEDGIFAKARKKEPAAVHLIMQKKMSFFGEEFGT